MNVSQPTQGSDNPAAHGMKNTEAVDTAEKGGVESSHTASSVGRRWDGSSRQRVGEGYDETWPRALQQNERSMYAVIISASAISISMFWTIWYNTRNLSNRVASQQRVVEIGELYAAMRSRISPETSLTAPRPSVTSIPCPTHPVIDPAQFSVIWANLFWIASLAFSLFAVGRAAAGIQLVRHYKHTPILHGQFLKSAHNRSSSVDRVLCSIASRMDVMFKSFQVALIILLLGYIDAIFVPVGVKAFAVVVIWGLYYVFRRSDDLGSIY